MSRWKLVLILVCISFFAVRAFALNTLSPITEGIVATVSGEIIFKSDIKDYEGTEYEDSAIQNLIELKVLYLLGRDLGIEVDNNELRQYLSQEVQRLKNYYGGEELLREAVNRMGYSFENFLKLKEDEIRENIIALKMKQSKISEFRAGIIVSRNQVIDYFNKHKDAFMRPERRRISHILIKFSSEADKEKAKQKAMEVYQKIKAGMDFATAAKKYSEAPTAVNGGDIGFVSKGTILPEIEAAAFSMEKGEVSEPVLTEIGYQIIYVTDIIPGELYDISDPEVFKKVRETYINSLIQKEYYNWLNQEMQKLNIEILKN